MSPAADRAADAKIRVRLWDGPTRLIHWALVLLVAASWWTHEIGRMDWHRWSGYSVLALLVFRIFWGFVGGSTARFGAFLKGPAAVAAYARTLFRPGAAALPGHNPLGGWSVAAMLLALVAQVVLGVFAVDVDGIESGPLSQYVSFDLGRRFAEWHELSFNILLALIVLHIVAVIFYLVVKRDNLIAAMVTGRRLMSSEPKEIRFAPWWMVLVGVAIAAAVAYVVMKGGRL
jgi:cytochrome b